MTSADACKIACATDAGNHLGSDTTGVDATCEQQCSPTNAPADSGRKAWISGNWSTTCKPTVCNAGYDDHDGNDTCEKTEAGFYASGSDRKDRQQCTVRYIDKKAKPASQNAVWSLAESTPLAVSAHTCRWDCKRGYEENLQGTDCVLKVPRVIAFGIGNAKNIGNGRWGVKTRQLNLQVAETHVSYYYVTHESTFNPSLGAKKDDDGSTEGGRQWKTEMPKTYELPDTDGEYHLYLWYADGEGTIRDKLSTATSIWLDRTAPGVPSFDRSGTHPKEKNKDASVSFSKLTSTDASGGEVSFIYCQVTDSVDCSQDSEFTEVSSWPLSVETATVGSYTVKFKSKDKLDNDPSTAFSYPWNRVECLYSATAEDNDKDTDNIFTAGTKERACQSDSYTWADWQITCDTPDTHGVNAAKTACITCGVGQYLVLGACANVASDHFSSAGSISQESCGDDNHPNSDSSECETDDCSSDIDHGKGIKTAHNVACQMISCDAGYHEDSDNTGNCIQIPENSGQYSLDAGKTATSCESNPEGSEWIMSAGADSANNCNWDCKADHTEYNSVQCFANTKDCQLMSGDASIGSGTQAYTQDTDGTYGGCVADACETGWKKHTTDGSCVPPSAVGKYIDGSGA